MILNQHTQHSLKDHALEMDHFQRTVAYCLLDMSELFEPLENATRYQLIPALEGQEVSDAERLILALALRHVGLGLTSDFHAFYNCELQRGLMSCLSCLMSKRG